MPLIARNPGADSSPACGAGRKVTGTHQALLWPCLNDDPTCPSRLGLQALADTPGPMAVTLRPSHRWRKAWGALAGQGGHAEPARKKSLRRRGLASR